MKTLAALMKVESRSSSWRRGFLACTKDPSTRPNETLTEKRVTFPVDDDLEKPRLPSTGCGHNSKCCCYCNSTCNYRFESSDCAMRCVECVRPQQFINIDHPVVDHDYPDYRVHETCLSHCSAASGHDVVP